MLPDKPHPAGRTRTALLSLIALAPFCAGCGAAVGDVAGKVTYKGQPLAGGSVNIVDPAGTMHQAVIGDDGSYTISQVPVGDAKVAVSYVDPAVNDYLQEMARGSRSGLGSRSAGKDSTAPPPKLDESKLKKIPEHYGDAEKSGLKTTVNKGQNTYDITLK